MDSDCALASDARHCCGCARAYPRILVYKEPCLHDYNVNHPPPAHCRPAACKGIKCKPCPGPPTVSCVPSSANGINRCVPFAWY